MLSKRPTCCNIGCSRPCHVSGGTKTRHIYRPYCAQCHHATMGKRPFDEGVTPVKTNYCENKDGRLGFKCYARGRKMPSCMLDLDHISGNHHNNRRNNLQTLCKCCHSYKTKMNGDGARQGRY
jgi:hypothetical protein